MEQTAGQPPAAGVFDKVRRLALPALIVSVSIAAVAQAAATREAIAHAAKRPAARHAPTAVAVQPHPVAVQLASSR